jgi:ribosome-associated protein
MDKKAGRLVLQDLRGLSDMCQYQLICSGTNERQTQAICQGIEDQLRKVGLRPLAIEGKQTGQWILVDYGSVLIHVFFNYIRDYYSLEELWPGARFVDLPANQAPA